MDKEWWPLIVTVVLGIIAFFVIRFVFDKIDTISRDIEEIKEDRATRTEEVNERFNKIGEASARRNEETNEKINKLNIDILKELTGMKIALSEIINKK